MNKRLAISAIIITIVSLGLTPMENPFDNKDSLHKVLASLGVEQDRHVIINPDDKLVKKGYDIVTKGFTKNPEGNKSKRVSLYFSCTDCHNLVQEDPDLLNLNPQTRLDYAFENKLPFLQGSTLWGVTNRKSWYNGDYEKKYGTRAKKSNKDLTEAIQLCAEVCSQGRPLENWEMEALLHYFSSNSMTWADVKKNPEVKQAKTNQELIEAINSSYFPYSPATFSSMPQRLDLGYEYKGNPENGEKIFKLSCRTCHDKDGPSTVEFDYSPLTFKDFTNSFLDKGNFNLYKIVSQGTYPEMGHPAYMPLYPLERMSHQQVEDLKAYMVQMANK